MATLLITYDLDKPDQQYEKVWAYLKQLGARRGLQSVWFAKTAKTPKEVCRELLALVDDNDRVFVCQVDTWWARGLMKSVIDWLKS